MKYRITLAYWRAVAAFLWWRYRHYMGTRPSHRYSTYEADMLKYRAKNATAQVAKLEGRMA